MQRVNTTRILFRELITSRCSGLSGPWELKRIYPAQHFNKKVQKIWAELDVACSSNVVMRENCVLLVSFVPASGEEIHKIVSRLKRRELDLLPKKAISAVPSIIGTSHHCYYQQVACRGNSANILERGSCLSAAEEVIIGPGHATELQACYQFTPSIQDH